MFSGQGSQYFHMGKALYENHHRFQLWMDYCDDIVAPLIGVSLIDVLYDVNVDKGVPFDRVLHTNPAIVCIEYSLARVLMEQGIQADLLLGYSLGEFTAAIVSGALDLTQGLELLVNYARLLEAKTPASGMLAVIDNVQLLHDEAELFADVCLTEKHFHKNFVVSGRDTHITALHEALTAKAIVCQRLAVNYGFHTALIEPIKEELLYELSCCQFAPPSIPTYSALTASPVSHYSAAHFWQVSREAVDFERTIEQLLQHQAYTFIDVGPSGTLATFVKYLLPKNSPSASVELMNQFGRDLNTLDKALQVLV